MKRWAIRYQSEGENFWYAIGKGGVSDMQSCHLYTSYELAAAKFAHFSSKPQWWQNVEIVEFDVTVSVDNNS